MAAQIGSLYVSLTANIQPFASGMSRAEAITARSAANIRKHAGVAEGSVNRFFSSAGRSNFRPYSMIAVSRAFENAADRANLLRGALLATSGVLGGFGGALGTNLILRYADSYTKLINQVRAVSDSAADAKARFGAIDEVATRSRSSLEATAILYSRLQKASPDRTPEQLLRYVETIQKALALGGATAQEARSAAIQFSQAIASNRLSGDEIRAVLETPLGLELAKGLGVTIGKLREMGMAGQLTAEVVLGGLSKIEKEIDIKFARSAKTMDQALVNIDNRFTTYIGTLNKAFGGTSLIIRGMDAFAANLESIIPTLAIVAAGFGAISVARHKAFVASLGIGGLGALVGGQVGGASGAIIGGLLGGIAGHKATNFGTVTDAAGNEKQIGLITAIRNQSAAAKENVRNLTAQVVDLRKQYIAAGLQANAARRAAEGDLTKLAPGSAQSGLLRARMAVQKLDEEKLRVQEQMRGQYQKLGDEAVKSTAKERLAIKGSIAAYQDRLNKIDALRAQAVAAVAFPKSVAAQAGKDVATANVAQTAASYRNLGDQLRKTQVELLAAGRAATVAGQAKMFLGRQVSSLVGLFGGPWGVAITGAIALMGYLGLRAQQAAQKIANAQQDIRDRLGELAAAGSQEAARSLADRRVKELRDTLDNYRALLDDFENRVKNATPVSISTDKYGTFQRRAEILDIRDAVIALSKEFAVGAFSESEFKARLDAIVAKHPEFAEMARIAYANRQELAGMAAAARAVNKEIDDLAAKAAKPIDFRFSVAFDPSSDKANAPLSDTADVMRDLADDLEVSKLRAKGLTAEATAQEIVNKAKANGKVVSLEAILPMVRQKEAADKLAAAFKKEGTEAETLTTRLARLKIESTGAFLPDLDRDVVRQARELKVAASDIKAYIAAAQSGDFSKAPAKLVDLRDQKLYDNAAESARGLVEQYGNIEQIAPLAAAKQQELAIAVQNGAITAGQASIAYADFLDQFQATKGIEDFARAVGDFASDAILDFENLGASVGNFLKRIAQLIVQLTVVEPLVNAIKGGFGAAASSGGGFFSTLFSGLFGVGGGGGVGNVAMGALYHGGGRVGEGGHPMMAGNFAGAPRLHDGLTSREFRAVLEEGEHVLTRQVAGRTASTIDGLSKASLSGGMNFTYAPQISMPGADLAAVTRMEAVLAEDRATFGTRVAKAVREIQRRR